MLYRKLIEKVSNIHDSAKYAKQQMQLYKADIVQSMNEEYKEMMQQALDEVSAESLCMLVVYLNAQWCVITDVAGSCNS